MKRKTQPNFYQSSGKFTNDKTRTPVLSFIFSHILWSSDVFYGANFKKVLKQFQVEILIEKFVEICKVKCCKSN